MHDHSHKLLFLALTGLMCAAALYGAQVGPEMFEGSPQAAAGSVPKTFSVPHQGVVTAASVTPQALDN